MNEMERDQNSVARKNRHVKYLLPAIVLVGLIVGAGVLNRQFNVFSSGSAPGVAHGAVGEQVKPDDIPTVRVEAVEALTVSQPESILAVVEAKETVTLVPRVAGYLTKILFQEGSTVQKGDLLIEIEETVYKMNVKVAESVVRQIEAEIELATKDLERTITLHHDRVVSDQALDEAERTLNLQKAKLDEAKATQGLAENDLSYTKIHAPLTGRIGAKNVSEGNYLPLGSGALATIVQYDPITVIFTLSETKYIRYFLETENEEKEPILKIFRTDGKPYEGEFSIDFTDNLVDRGTGTMAIHLICRNVKDQLLPGGWCRIHLSERYLKPVPSVAVSAVMTDGDRHHVYVVTAESKAERRDITLGEQVYDRYIVKEGLREGERVIVGGLNKVVDGNTIRTAPAKSETGESEQK